MLRDKHFVFADVLVGMRLRTHLTGKYLNPKLSLETLNHKLTLLLISKQNCIHVQLLLIRGSN